MQSTVLVALVGSFSLNHANLKRNFGFVQVIAVLLHACKIRVCVGGGRRRGMNRQSNVQTTGVRKWSPKKGLGHAFQLWDVL